MKTVDRVLVEWVQDLLERHPEMELAICQAKVDLWDGPVEGQLSFPHLVDKIREWADENVPGTLWLDLQAETWTEDEPVWNWNDDDGDGENREDWSEVDRSLLMRVLLGELSQYV